jgi:hypothetical protein
MDLETAKDVMVEHAAGASLSKIVLEAAKKIIAQARFEERRAANSPWETDSGETAS